MAKSSDKELYSKIIKKVIAKEITQKEASLKLEITDRQVRRLIVKYKNIGEEAFVHKNSNKPSNNKKIPNDISNRIIETYLNDFSDYGFTHFYEEHGYKYGISFSTMINIFITNEIISPYAQHKTVRLYNDNMNKAIREKSITIEQEQLFEQRKQE